MNKIAVPLSEHQIASIKSYLEQHLEFLSIITDPQIDKHRNEMEDLRKTLEDIEENGF
jgi:hypothetical protein